MSIDGRYHAAAYLTDRTRRAIRERRLTGESLEALAEDYDVPVQWVTWLCTWQLFGDDPQPDLVNAALLDACKEALMWYGPDGDHIGEPWRSQLLAAIAKAEGHA